MYKKCEWRVCANMITYIRVFEDNIIAVTFMFAVWHTLGPGLTMVLYLTGFTTYIASSTNLANFGVIFLFCSIWQS